MQVAEAVEVLPAQTTAPRSARFPTTSSSSQATGWFRKRAGCSAPPFGRVGRRAHGMDLWASDQSRFPLSDATASFGVSGTTFRPQEPSDRDRAGPLGIPRRPRGALFWTPRPVPERRRSDAGRRQRSCLGAERRSAPGCAAGAVRVGSTKSHQSKATVPDSCCRSRPSERPER
jgi:hypothetical protein